MPDQKYKEIKMRQDQYKRILNLVGSVLSKHDKILVRHLFPEITEDAVRRIMVRTGGVCGCGDCVLNTVEWLKEQVGEDH